MDDLRLGGEANIPMVANFQKLQIAGCVGTDVQKCAVNCNFISCYPTYELLKLIERLADKQAAFVSRKEVINLYNTVW